MLIKKGLAKYRSLKMEEASLGMWSIFAESVGICRTRQRLNMHKGNKSASKRFRILVQLQEALEMLYESCECPVLRER